MSKDEGDIWEDLANGLSPNFSNYIKTKGFRLKNYVIDAHRHKQEEKLDRPKRIIDVTSSKDEECMDITCNVIRYEKVDSDLGNIRLELYNTSDKIRAGICKYGENLWAAIEDFVGILEAVGWNFYRNYVKDGDVDPYLRQGYIIVAFTPSNSWIAMYAPGGNRNLEKRIRGDSVTEALLKLSAELKEAASVT